MLTFVILFRFFPKLNRENFGFATAKQGILDSATANLEIEKMPLRTQKLSDFAIIIGLAF